MSSQKVSKQKNNAIFYSLSVANTARDIFLPVRLDVLVQVQVQGVINNTPDQWISKELFAN